MYILAQPFCIYCNYWHYVSVYLYLSHTHILPWPVSHLDSRLFSRHDAGAYAIRVLMGVATMELINWNAEHPRALVVLWCGMSVSNQHDPGDDWVLDSLDR